MAKKSRNRLVNTFLHSNVELQSYTIKPTYIHTYIYTSRFKLKNGIELRAKKIVEQDRGGIGEEAV